MKAEAPISCARAQALLESYLDGELPPRRLQRFERHLLGCQGCQAELAMARRVQSGLHELPRLPCPEHVGVKVLEAAGVATTGGRSGATAGGRGWVAAGRSRWAAIWRPALALAGTAATALLIISLSRHSGVPPSYPPEVLRAEREARWALAYVAGVTQRASDQALENVVGEVVYTVIGERVVVPVTDAVRKPLEEK